MCSSDVLLTVALDFNSDIPGIYFNSRYVTVFLKCKILQIDILGAVEHQSEDESFSIRVTDCSSLNVPAVSVFSLSLVLNALSCSVVASHSALRKEGRSPRWDPSSTPEHPHPQESYFQDGLGRILVLVSAA